MASVREIAKVAGVSKTTVSMVLRHHSGVSDVMRQRVQEAVDYLHTIEEARVAEENMSVTAVASPARPCSLLVLHPSDAHSSAVFHEILRGIQTAASLYKIQLNLAFNDFDILANQFGSLYFSDPILQPNGILVLGARVNEPVVDRIASMNIPIVLVGRRVQKLGISSVGRDEESAACEATSCLFHLGHRSVAFVGGSEKYAYTIDRIAGYRRAFAQYGFPFNEAHIRLGFDIAAAAEFLLSSPEITAAVFVNELHASQVLPLVQKAGRVIPKDLSVVCFDDTEISRSFDPPLSSVSFPFFQEGFWSVRTLMEQIRQPEIVSSQIVFRAKLVKRKSCGPPKGASSN